jgi:integrase
MPRRGADIWRDRYAKHAHRNFRETATVYLKEFDGKDKRRVAYCLESLLPYIGELPLIEVTSETLSQFKEDRLRGQGFFKKPAMVGTVNKELTQAVTILNWACRDMDWIPRVPRIRHVKGPRREPCPISWDEQKLLFEALPSGWDMLAALFAINTGVRKSELFGLRWRDKVEIPELDTYVFILTDTKNGQDRAVICNSVAKRAIGHARDMRKIWRKEIGRIRLDLQLGHYKTPTAVSRAERKVETLHRRLTSGLVFPSYMGREINSVAKVFNKAWIAAGLPDDRFVKKGIHNLRHSYGHRLRAAGVPAEDRDALLGHSNKSLTQHYAMPDIERLQAMAERVVERKDTVILRPVRSAV